MGRKSGAEEGPVHTPRGRHNAMKQKKPPNEKHNRTNQKPNKDKEQRPKQNKGVIPGDTGPYSEMTSHYVKKRRAQICDQIQRFIKIPTGLRRQTRMSNTHTKRKRRACSRKPN